MSSSQLCTKKLISVITVTYNNKLEIKSFLKSLFRQNIWRASFELELVIIDNNSTDCTKEIIKQTISNLSYFDHCLFIQNRANLGFSKAVNQGLKMSKGDFILLANPDIFFNREDTLLNLVSCLERSQAHIVGGLLTKVMSDVTVDKLKKSQIHGTFVRKPCFLTGIFEFTNLKKLLPENRFYKRFYYLNEDKPLNSRYVDAVSGALMLFKKHLLNEIGLFDEKFFLYLEDVDFCLRAKSAGFKVYFCNKAIAYHYGGASSKHKRGNVEYDEWVKARSLFFRKHSSYIGFCLLNVIFTIDNLLVRFFKKLCREEL